MYTKIIKKKCSLNELLFAIKQVKDSMCKINILTIKNKKNKVFVEGRYGSYDNGISDVDFKLDQFSKFYGTIVVNFLLI